MGVWRLLRNFGRHIAGKKMTYILHYVILKKKIGLNIVIQEFKGTWLCVDMVRHPAGPELSSSHIEDFESYKINPNLDRCEKTGRVKRKSI